MVYFLKIGTIYELVKSYCIPWLKIQTPFSWTTVPRCSGCWDKPVWLFVSALEAKGCGSGIWFLMEAVLQACRRLPS